MSFGGVPTPIVLPPLHHPMPPRRVFAQRRPHFRTALPAWINWPLFVVLALVPIIIATLVRPEHLFAALLAYLNLLLIGAAWVYFTSRGTLQGLFPGLFLTWLGASWPLASLYFAVAAPDLTYQSMFGDRQFLFNATRLQLVTFSFLVAYLSVMWGLERREAPWHTPVVNRANDRRVATVALCLVMAAIGFNVVGKLRPLPGVAQYVADGGYLYLHSLALVVGAMFTSLAMRTRILWAVFLVVAGAFYFIGNARSMATLPVALFVVGLIFLSDLQRRWKHWIVVSAMVCFPVALVVGNTTRAITLTVGFHDLETRLRAMRNWQEVLARTPVLTSTFDRLFFTAGHTIVAFSPEQFAYIDFSFKRYGVELVTRLLPRRFMRELYYSEQPNRILRSYGFLITDETSEPLSMIGSLYMLGGFLPVVGGGILVGLFHTGIRRYLQAARRRSPYLAVFSFAMIASEMLWGHNRDLISHVRTLVWNGIGAFVLFQLCVRPVAGSVPARTPRRERAAQPAPPQS
jgi:hypothetical protein